MNALSKAKLEYRYEDGATAAIIFNGNVLDVEWLSGPFKGAKRSALEYKCRELGNERFLINWHDLEGPGFVTLNIDIDAGKVHGSAILNYTQEEPIELFDEATILSFTQNG